ncbi:Resolvase, N terminal domain [Mycobacteroides abscessus subsp. abscessus]|nr:Resolvase, N terminal domain [Mycobacteroides abscessus subsp. abscessus]
MFSLMRVVTSAFEAFLQMWVVPLNVAYVEREVVLNTQIYLRASTKDQDAQRALNQLDDLNQRLKLGESVTYIENFSGTKLDRPELNRLLTEANQGDTLLVE